MPTYDYQCRSCGHTIEVVHAMSEDGPTTCEVCGGELRRILHPAGIIFKGTGFYKTDSRSASSASVPSGTKGGTTTESAPSKGSEGSTPAGGADAKPSTKPKGASAAAD